MVQSCLSCVHVQQSLDHFSLGGEWRRFGNLDSSFIVDLFLQKSFLSSVRDDRVGAGFLCLYLLLSYQQIFVFILVLLVFINELI